MTCCSSVTFINGLRYDETDLRELVPAVEQAAAEL
jgi:hypothetical protein